MDAREKNRLKAAEYRLKNPEKVREIQRRSNAKRRQDPERVVAIRAYQAQYRLENRQVLRDRERERRFGVSRREYAEMYKQQNGVCAICSQPETATRKSVVKSLAVDHNHTTGKVRGLLCSACNTAIGKMRENPEILASAIQYLERHTESPILLFKRNS
jgi:hypothetical protein